ncbi:MAG TPA: methyltransferase domain-containing protein [Candidatus Fraserbacteria bacterium]|nr:methyltransferase domain-containing protein [Candidatus Fraserbacteria bacterium]
MTPESVNYSFVRFAEQSFYRQVNQALVNSCAIKPGQHIVDLACGTGAVTQLILQKLQGMRESLVIAIDSSAEALQQARAKLAEARNQMVKLVQGQAEQLSGLVRERVDAVILCNAIHMMAQKEEIAAEALRILRPGGVFAFNTTFFAGAQPEETAIFYRRWMYRAIRTLRSRYQLMPDKAAKVESRRQLSSTEYVELLHSQGFTLREELIKPVAVPLEGWLGISQFQDFIAGALPGVPLEAGRQALQQAVTQVFAELKLQFVPRNWLFIVAARP